MNIYSHIYLFFPMRQGLSWSFGCLGACFVDQVSLELRDLPVSASASEYWD